MAQKLIIITMNHIKIIQLNDLETSYPWLYKAVKIRNHDTSSNFFFIDYASVTPNAPENPLLYILAPYGRLMSISGHHTGMIEHCRIKLVRAEKIYKCLLELLSQAAHTSRPELLPQLETLKNNTIKYYVKEQHIIQ